MLYTEWLKYDMYYALKNITVTMSKRSYHINMEYMHVFDEKYLYIQNFIHKFYRSIKHIALTIIVIIVGKRNEFYIRFDWKEKINRCNVWTIKSINGLRKIHQKYVISGSISILSGKQFINEVHSSNWSSCVIVVIDIIDRSI